MSILSAMFTGVSGINSNGAALSIIGDNLANANTVGFKGSSPIFGDLLASSTGASSAVQVGNGSFLQTIMPIFTQGTLETTSNPLDLAIQGDGFFAVDVGGTKLYTRAGQFHVNSSGYIVNADKDLLQGRMVSDAGTFNEPGNINVKSTNSPPRPTSTVNIASNLNSDTVARDPANAFTMTDSNNSLQFEITGGANAGIYKASIPAGKYTATSLASQLQIALNGASGSNGFSVTSALNTFQISYAPGDTSSLDILWGDPLTNCESVFGFTSTNDLLVHPTIADGGSTVSDTAVYGNASTFLITPDNNTIVFNDIDPALGTILRTNTVTIPVLNGGYTGDGLAKAIQDALDAASLANGGTDVYTVSYDSTLMTFSIGNTAGNVNNIDFLWENSATTADQMLGFKSTNHAALSSGDAAESDFASSGFDALDPSGTSDYNTSLTFYDAIGGSHLITVYFRRTADASSGSGNNWQWYAVIPASDSVTGQAQVSASGELAFDTAGKLKTDINFNANVDFNFSGGVTLGQAVSFNFGTGTDENGSGLDGTTQFGNISSTITQEQDGYGAGSLQSLVIDPSGNIVGVFTNGQSKEIAQVLVTTFHDNSAMIKLGKGLYAATAVAGEPNPGAPGEQGRGKVISNSLEMSNVDMAAEFVKMIQAQRGFQASTKIISTSDTILQDVLNLIR